MPGVSSEDRRMMSLESYMPASFFNANGNGDVLPVFEEQQMCSPRFMSRDDINFLNGQRFLAKSLSFGSNPSSNGDDWPESFTKDEAYEAFISSSAPAALVGSSSSSSLLQSDAAFSALQKFLPSNNEDEASLNGVDAYSCDEFRMYDFKVRRCMRGRSHDWTECPFAHPGEKARRRDPRRFLYSGTACPDFRKGTCRRGDACEFAHGVFECWLHPGRYRTQPCKDGRNCRRRVCFFAHTPEQLRLVAPSASSPGGAASRSVKNHGYDGSPLRHAVSASASFDGAADVAGSNTVYFEGCSSPRGYLKSNFSQLQMSSPTSTLVGHSMHSPPSLSPPMSPAGSPPHNWPPLASGVWNASPVHNNKVLSQKSPNFANIDVSSAAQLHASLGRRHPSISIPPSHDGIPSPQALSNDAASPFSQHSPRAMADLINTFQHLEVNNGGVGGRDASSLWLQAQTNNMANAVPVHTCSPRGSNLRHCSYSLPCTPTKSRWENKFDSFEVEEPVQRVESGRDLRAKIYGRLSMENPENSSEASPDLGWVNELVK